MGVKIEPKLKLGINVPLLRKTLEHIEAHPEEHEQGSWAIRGLNTACGTAFCLAGHAVQFAGHEIDWVEGEVAASKVRTGDDDLDIGLIEDVAAFELGLTHDQSVRLFGFLNSRETLWHLANRYTHGEIEIPEKYL